MKTKLQNEKEKKENLPYLTKAAQHFKWDPEDNEGDNIEVLFDEDAFVAVVFDYIREVFSSTNTKDDCYKQPHMNSIFLMAGKISYEEWKSCIREPDERGKYKHALEGKEDYIKLVEEMMPKLYELHNTALPFDGTLTMPTPEQSRAIDAVLDSIDFPSLSSLVGSINSAESNITSAMDSVAEAQEETRAVETSLSTMKDTVKELTRKLRLNPKADTKIKATGEAPAGTVKTRKVSDLFDVPLGNLSEVPYWEWKDKKGKDAVHPDVPVIDPNHIFREKELTRALYALLTNQRAWFKGHTGCGKTTLIEQVAARLNWPLMRLNLDSDISRFELIGRDTLVIEDGKQVSKFEEGLLVKALSGPYILLLDEIDAVRAEVAYTMQSVIEGKGLRVLENGGMFVDVHPMSRIIATANTVGQGDEDNMYQGIRPQSMALLDRFTVWCDVDYLNMQEREGLIKGKVPALDAKSIKVINEYVEEHLQAFLAMKVIQPISPRGMEALGHATVELGDIKEAIQMGVIDKANNSDRAVLLGIVDRVCE